MKKTAIYPGCSLEGSSSGYAMSLERVLAHLDIEIPELKGWSCCGATSAHAINQELHLGLNLRNLALAEEQGFEEVLAPCAACYHRMAVANHELQENPDLLAEMNQNTGLAYHGNVKVRNVLDYLVNTIGASTVSGAVVNRLSGLKAACYYGCLNTRTPRMASFDVREYPLSMDNLLRSLGTETIDWSYKTECCGASLFISAEEVSAKLVSKILKDAVARGADCIVAACPMCQNNLDTKQNEIRDQFGISRPLPVVFVTQLIGLAFGIEEKKLGLKQNFVPFKMTMVQ